MKRRYSLFFLMICPFSLTKSFINLLACPTFYPFVQNSGSCFFYRMIFARVHTIKMCRFRITALPIKGSYLIYMGKVTKLRQLQPKIPVFKNCQRLIKTTAILQKKPRKKNGMDRNIIVSPQENGIVVMRKNFLKLLTKLIHFAHARIYDSRSWVLREAFHQGAYMFGCDKIIVVEKKKEFSRSVIQSQVCGSRAIALSSYSDFYKI